MEIKFRVTRLRIALLVGVVSTTAVGIGYAAIPGSDGSLNACMLNLTGTIRLVDPAAPATSLLSRPCNTRIETAVSWNQQGIQGLPGDKGDKGDKGDTGPAGSALVYTNYGSATPQDIGAGLTQTVASVTVPTGSYTLSATAAVSSVGDTRFGQCFFDPGNVNGTVALAKVADNGSVRLPVIGDVTVTAAASPVFLRCTGVDGTIRVAGGALIATRVGTITPSN